MFKVSKFEIFSHSRDALQQAGHLLGVHIFPDCYDGHFGLARIRRHLLHPADLHLLRVRRHYDLLRIQNVLGGLQVHLTLKLVFILRHLDSVLRYRNWPVQAIKGTISFSK
jgi:hypothetical protein